MPGYDCFHCQTVWESSFWFERFRLSVLYHPGEERPMVQHFLEKLPKLGDEGLFLKSGSKDGRLCRDKLRWRDRHSPLSDKVEKLGCWYDKIISRYLRGNTKKIFPSTNYNIYISSVINHENHCSHLLKNHYS
jgi:hypothetical protein